MGVIKQGILGGFQNKVGPVIGTSWKGINVIKSRPTSVAYSNTELQQEQRTAMRQIAAYLRSFGLENVRLLNNAQAVRMSGYNRCVKKVNTFKPGNELSGHVKCLASGSYTKPSFIASVALDIDTVNKTCTVNWQDLFGTVDVPADVKAMVTVQAPDGLSCTPAVYGRKLTGDTVIDLSKFPSFQNLVVGVCFISEDGMTTSDIVAVTL